MKKSLTKLLRKNNDDFAVEVKLEHDRYLCVYEGCGREFEKPILVTNKAVNPPETYLGCPYCLSKVDAEMPEVEKIEEKVEQTSKLVEIKKLIEKNAKKEEKKAKETECPYHFGYLKEKDKNLPIPEECLTCPKMLECML